MIFVCSFCVTMCRIGYRVQATGIHHEIFDKIWNKKKNRKFLNFIHKRQNEYYILCICERKSHCNWFVFLNWPVAGIRFIFVRNFVCIYLLYIRRSLLHSVNGNRRYWTRQRREKCVTSNKPNERNNKRISVKPYIGKKRPNIIRDKSDFRWYGEFDWITWARQTFRACIICIYKMNE